MDPFLPVIAGTVGVWLVLIVSRFYLGGPYVPTSNKRITSVLKLANIKPEDKVAELGSGDGRVVIALARAGGTVHGYEISPYLIWRSRRLVNKAGVQKNAQIFFKNFWNANLSQYDVIVLYGIRHIMPRLEKKLQRELKPGTRVISVYFTFPTWQASNTEDDVHFYIKK